MHKIVFIFCPYTKKEWYHKQTYDTIMLGDILLGGLEIIHNIFLPEKLGGRLEC